MTKTLLFTAIMLSFGISACNNHKKAIAPQNQIDSDLNQSTNDKNSFISIFEIPATEISRAIDFYQAILEITIEKIDIPEMQMGLFPYKEQMVTGVIIKGEGYQPSANGITLYLNGGDNLQVILDKVEKNGGEILVPKTPHGDESGYFALFLDTEGNKMGLHSPN